MKESLSGSKMTNKHLHIITHDLPWPADHGGLFDLFYKIKALHLAGIQIHLHCFYLHQPPQEELKNYAVSVNYYHRKKHFSRFSFRVPFIVNSRVNADLINNLEKDNHPILMEGIHTTFYLHSGKLDGRMLMVRLHNTEFEYYKQLARQETGFFKRMYYRHESRLLKKYEQKIAGKALFLAVSNKDLSIYQEVFHAKRVMYLPVFIPYLNIEAKAGKGCYCLYHGNLSVNENEQAVIWLLKNVFENLDIPFVIAGKDPSSKLERLAHSKSKTCLVANPDEKEMRDLIEKAHIHLLPSFNNTGIKLKLLNALFNGRHCIVNKAAVDGFSFEKYCHIAEDGPAFQNLITTLYQQEYIQSENEQRQELLREEFNNERNAQKIIDLL